MRRPIVMNKDISNNINKTIPIIKTNYSSIRMSIYNIIKLTDIKEKYISQVR